MPEPVSSRVRPIPMKRLALVAVLLVLAGCGSGEDASPDSKAEPTTVGGCAIDSSQVTEATTLVRVDLDGDGTPDQVRLTKPGGTCGSTLFAKTGEGYVASTVAVEPSPTSAFGADPGSAGQLLVTRAEHPRGGFQLRVYSAGNGKLVELQSDGQPLLPFVATDVQEHPWSIDCSEDGLVFTEAVAHEPPGVAPAWDIRRTVYSVDGTSVTAGPSQEIADNVLPKELPAKYPDLVKHTAFASCRAG